jgi:hypothetical protein
MNKGITSVVLITTQSIHLITHVINWLAGLTTARGEYKKCFKVMAKKKPFLLTREHVRFAV